MPDPWLQAAPAEREDGELTPDVCALKIHLDASIRHPLVTEQVTGIGMHRLAEINRAVLG